MSCFWRSAILLLIGLFMAPVHAIEDHEQVFYKNLKDTSVKVKNHLIEKDFDYKIVPGAVVLLIEQQSDEQGELWIRLGLESENFVASDQAVNAFEGAPSDIKNASSSELTNASTDLWIRAQDFYNLDLIEDTVYRMTYCYRYVKKYLLKKGFVDTYLPGVSAYMAVTILPKHGFSKSKRTPAQAKTYDVCVYKGGPSGHGHIEVRDPQGWYYGYGYKNQPIKNRTFLGCFFKLLSN